MLASTPTSEYVSYRATKRDQSMSPSCRFRSMQTPPRLSTSSTLTYNSPMLTPSPLRRFDPPSAEPMDMDDIFQSPPAPASKPQPRKARATRLKAQVFTDDDDDDDLDGSSSLLAPSSSFLSRTLAPPSSPLPQRTPLRTPVRQSLWAPGTPDRPALTVKHVNTLPSKSPALGTGMKRKPTPSLRTTPLPTRALTPLSITSGSQREGEVGFDRLAPLPAPRFHPPTPADAEQHLNRQQATMNLLKITDLHGSEDESGYDSGLEVNGGQRPSLQESLASTPSRTAKAKGKVKTPSLDMSMPPAVVASVRQGQSNLTEVAEVSPGGHVTKRRARSRPVSAELLDAAQTNTTVITNQANAPPIYESSHTGLVAFPTRPRRTSGSSIDSELGSPVPRLRLTPGALPRTRTQSHSRTALSRMASSGSASTFFGPSITNARPKSTRKVTSTSRGAVGATPTPARNEPDRHLDAHPKAYSRHSYAGPEAPIPRSWLWPNTGSPSPVSSPNLRKRPEESSDDEDIFFNGPPDTSFNFSVTAETPSPKKRQRREAPSPLQKKFRPRDSGIVLDSSDDDAGPHTFVGDPFIPAMPSASTSVSTVNSEDDQPLVTPGFEPSASSGWPGAGFRLAVRGSDSDEMDAIILKTLTAGASKPTQSHSDAKRPPGTPVKKIKTAHLGQRPWQSAISSKVGLPEYDDEPRGKGKGKPRKSLPAAFPLLGKENRQQLGRGPLAMDVDEGDDDTSPVTKRNSKYDGVGLGRPSNALPLAKGGKPSWLLRRTSSGTFSSGSDTCNSASVTPTRPTVKAFKLPPVRLPMPESPLKKSLDFTGHSTPTEVSTPTVTFNSPSFAASARKNGLAVPQATPARTTVFARPQTHAHPARMQRGNMSPPRIVRGWVSLPTGEEQPGRFDRDFIEVDEVGTGEFGRVMKVRYKEGVPAGREKEGQLYAVKKSKRFEGAKHRLRLREEVDTLAHLSRRGGHPNVLAYIDSWEEDETLYIRTELCSLGNLANFLASYGRVYPRLDEGRVWRILAELSAGLRFIHESGVIHLDIKPANIFIVESGRLRIGDFGMASLWPRPPRAPDSLAVTAFEREGDKLYLAPEVLQGDYGKAADVFSLGMTILETATNIVVPGQGEAWHRLRREDFSQIDTGLETLSCELRVLIRSMMRTEPALRAKIALVATHPIVVRAQEHMDTVRAVEGDVFAASPLGGVKKGFLEMILQRPYWDDERMDLSF